MVLRKNLSKKKADIFHEEHAGKYKKLYIFIEMYQWHVVLWKFVKKKAGRPKIRVSIALNFHIMPKD